ncbi:MAG: hypothetical protein L6Q33_02555 [Bacteriovoracaceae bacterium]|nr:hypothetical protein [Bacteriovoracaceae bacterium]
MKKNQLMNISLIKLNKLLLLSLSVSMFHPNAYAETPQKKSAAEIKAFMEQNKIIDSSKTGDNDCKYINYNEEKIAELKKFVPKDSIPADDADLQKFLNKIHSTDAKISDFKSNAICANIAYSKDNTQAQIAFNCLTKNPLTFHENKDCIRINSFLLKERFSGNFTPTKPSPTREFKNFKTIAEGVSCESEGSITIDYEPCVAFANAFTTITQAQTLVHQGQEVWAQGESQTAMAKAQGKSDDPKAALGAQKTSMEAQSQVLKQRAALEAGKLAYLVSLFKKIPDADTITSKVSDSDTAKILLQPASGVLINQEQRDEFKQQLINIGGVAVSQMIMAKIADSRIDAIDDAMAKVDAFKPVDFNVLSEDATVAYCQQNPADPKCMSGDLSYQVDPFSGESISFGAGATGTSYSPIDPNSSTASNAVNPNGPNGKKTFDSLGNVITPVDKSNNLVDTSSAATLGEGNGPQSVGGGGAGGGGAGGGGGGGGGPTGQKQAESVSAAGTSSKAAYSGGSGVSVMGGLGIGGKKTGKDEANPFADMFKNKTANANGVLNLRGPASVGKKEGNIFQQISSRYKEVSSEGSRLLEYQQAK